MSSTYFISCDTVSPLRAGARHQGFLRQPCGEAGGDHPLPLQARSYQADVPVSFSRYSAKHNQAKPSRTAAPSSSSSRRACQPTRSRTRRCHSVHPSGSTCATGRTRTATSTRTTVSLVLAARLGHRQALIVTMLLYVAHVLTAFARLFSRVLRRHCEGLPRGTRRPVRRWLPQRSGEVVVSGNSNAR